MQVVKYKSETINSNSSKGDLNHGRRNGLSNLWQRHDMQFVEIELNPNEGVRAQPGAMLYMNDNIEMQTNTEGVIYKNEILTHKTGQT